MRNMDKRIAALEAKSAPAHTRWRRIIVDGQSKADALEEYEQAHGTIGTNGIIYRVIVDPLSNAAGGSMQ